MTEPPSMWLVLPVAAVCLWQSFRLAQLRRATGGLVGDGTEYVMYLSFVPAGLAMLSAEAVPALAGVIEWSRYYVMALLVSAVMATELAFQVARLFGAYRLAHAAETSENVAVLERACAALQALGCYDMAVAGYRRLEERSPDPARVQRSMAALFAIRRRFLEAEVYARRAVASDPTSGLAHAYLCMVLLEQGRDDEARSCRATAERLGVDFREFSTFRLLSREAT